MKSIFIYFLLLATLSIAFGQNNSAVKDKDLVVRIAKLQIDSTQLKEYTAALTEEIQASVRVEPGVKTLYAVAEKEHPNHITVFEIYANADAFKAHLETPHFKKYKASTKEMVQSLDLKETVSMVLATKPVAERKNEFIRVVNIVIDSTHLENFKVAIKEDAEAAIKKEPGIYTLYVVEEKNNPNHITVFEIYASEQAHQSHQQTAHFKKYKDTINGIVKSTVRTVMIPVVLEAKPISHSK